MKTMAIQGNTFVKIESISFFLLISSRVYAERESYSVWLISIGLEL